jgi:two-component system OmpR family sensor kinase
VTLFPRTLRGRIVLTFTVLTVLLAGGFGSFVVVEFRSSLDSSLNSALHSRFQQVEQVLDEWKTTDVRQALGPLIPQAESFAQVIDVDNHVQAAAPESLTRTPILTPQQIAQARIKNITITADVAPRGGEAELYAGRSEVGDTQALIVIGTHLSTTIAAEHRLIVVLIWVLSLFTLFVSIGSWLVAGAILRPVRRLITEAESLSTTNPGSRLTPQGGSEIAELASELNAMLLRIEQALAHERAFLDDASHELRTPIAIVRGEVELARMSVESGSETAAALDSVAEEVGRLDRLANNLLVLARTRASRVTPRPIESLAVVGRRSADAVTRGRDVAVEITVMGDAAMLGDETALERAMANLIENAARFARQRVAVTIATSGTAVSIAIADDGPGFPPAVLAGDFDRFGGTAVGGQPDGAGLGLVIVAEIVRAHGGSTVMTNPETGGAVATLRFPLTATDRAGRPIPALVR